MPSAASLIETHACALQIADPSSDHLRLEHSEAEREAAADIAQRFAVEICDLLRRMPRALLLLLKTNDCLRSVDYALGTVRACPSEEFHNLALTVAQQISSSCFKPTGT